MIITDTELHRFVMESNRIEGIHHTLGSQVRAHREFLSSIVTVEALVALVSVLQPDARLRDRPGVPSVRVGDHVAPPSGPEIRFALESVLLIDDPWLQHVEYETLHPFTDGNGRSGRALWLWRYNYAPNRDPWAIRRGFLHSWYYHTLSQSRA